MRKKPGRKIVESSLFKSQYIQQNTNNKNNMSSIRQLETLSKNAINLDDQKQSNSKQQKDNNL